MTREETEQYAQGKQYGLTHAKNNKHELNTLTKVTQEMQREYQKDNNTDGLAWCNGWFDGVKEGQKRA